MDNRHGLAIDARLTQAGPRGEWEAALEIGRRTLLVHDAQMDEFLDMGENRKDCCSRKLSHWHEIYSLAERRNWASNICLGQFDRITVITARYRMCRYSGEGRMFA